MAEIGFEISVLAHMPPFGMDLSHGQGINHNAKALWLIQHVFIVSISRPGARSPLAKQLLGLTA